MRNADQQDRAPQSEPSEGERFTRMLDGLLAVPHAEVAAAIEQDKAAKAKNKLKASSGVVRAGNARKR